MAQKKRKERSDLNRKLLGQNALLPQKFIEFLTEVAGDSSQLIISAIKESNPPVSIRLNPFKPVVKRVDSGTTQFFSADSVVHDAIITNDMIPWCSNGYYLKERPVFTLDPTFHAGAYYVQESSSMFLEMLNPLLQKLSPLNVLDLCAAPGGKSTHLISILPPGTQITVNEVVKPRLSVLRENIIKWGVPGINVTSKEAHQFTSQLFDFILVDAPCSGEGMFRKDSAAISEWSEENVRMCAARQKNIVKDIWNALRPGGVLAYSTCTFNKYENDDNVLWFRNELGAQIISLEEIYEKEGLGNSFNHKVRAEWGIKKSPQGGYQFFPGFVLGEGFYFALLYKPEYSINSTDLNNLNFEKATSKERKPAIDKRNSANTPHNKNFPARHSSQRATQTHTSVPTHEEALTIDITRLNTDAHPFVAASQNSSHKLNHKSYSDSQHSSDLSQNSLKNLNHNSQGYSQHSFDASQNSSHKLNHKSYSDSQHPFYDSRNSKSKFQNKSDEYSDKQSGNKVYASGDFKSVKEQNGGEWPEYELTKEQALKYLSRESLVLQNAPLGYLKVTYGGLGLGFVKNIGTRANNLLPTNLRIRKQ
jgi:16S rRNA C967 or C1407 C5-methylase (RsmB/RsmF family)